MINFTLIWTYVSNCEINAMKTTYPFLVEYATNLSLITANNKRISSPKFQSVFKFNLKKLLYSSTLFFINP